MSDLHAGHARGCVTPPLGIKMSGYGQRTEGATDVHDDLFVDAVALQGDGRTLLLLAYDLISFNNDIAAEMKAAISARTGVGPESILLNTSHTHAGPRLGAFGGEDFDATYRTGVGEKSAEVAAAAIADLAPAEFSAGRAPVDIGCNRRESTPKGIILGHNPDGPTLKEVTVWRLARHGATDIVLFSIPMHGTTLGGRNLSISAEWMGAAKAHIEADVPDTRAVFLQGCGADQDPYYSMVDGVRGTFEEVEQHGRDAATSVIAALQDMRRLNPLPIRTARRDVVLPGKEDAARTRELALRGWRLGDAILLSLGAEAFVEFALFGRAQSPATETLVLGYSDGNIGYLCTPDVYEAGGYEANTTGVAPQSEQITKGAMQDVMRALWA
jgi:neutral ceramidase